MTVSFVRTQNYCKSRNKKKKTKAVISIIIQVDNLHSDWIGMLRVKWVGMRVCSVLILYFATQNLCDVITALDDDRHTSPSINSLERFVFNLSDLPKRQPRNAASSKVMHIQNN